VVIDKKSQKIICTAFSNGKRHDFRLFKESGLQKIHANTILPKKRSKKAPLSKQDKLDNQGISRDSVLNENVIGLLKRFKIITDRYRNRRKRFCLRFNLIAGIYNLECL